MFGLFKSNPVKALKKEYERKLEAAMNAQRNGDMRTHSDLMTEADALYERILAAQEGK